jgi:hypothetical protein
MPAPRAQLLQLLSCALLNAAIMEPTGQSVVAVSDEEAVPFQVGSGDSYPSGNIPDPAIVLDPAIWELSRPGVEQMGEDSQGCDGDNFLDFVAATNINSCVDCCRANSLCAFVSFYGSDPRSFLHDYYDPNSPLCKLMRTCDTQSSTATQPTKSYSVMQDNHNPTFMPERSQLAQGESIQEDEMLTSENQRNTLRVQTDGNLVLYGSQQAVLWEAGTSASCSGEAPCHLDMQMDGNLVLYGPEQAVLWATNTAVGSGDFRLDLQDDGNLVLYNKPNKAVWSSGTMPLQESGTSETQTVTQRMPAAIGAYAITIAMGTALFIIGVALVVVVAVRKQQRRAGGATENRGAEILHRSQWSDATCTPSAAAATSV